jgi:hypothetical protein
VQFDTDCWCKSRDNPEQVVWHFPLAQTSITIVYAIRTPQRHPRESQRSCQWQSGNNHIYACCWESSGKSGFAIGVAKRPSEPCKLLAMRANPLCDLDFLSDLFRFHKNHTIQ